MKRKAKRQIVVKISGDYELCKRLLDVVEQRTEGIASKIMPSSTRGDYHTFITVFEVLE